MELKLLLEQWKKFISEDILDEEMKMPEDINTSILVKFGSVDVTISYENQEIEKLQDKIEKIYDLMRNADFKSDEFNRLYKERELLYDQIEHNIRRTVNGKIIIVLNYCKNIADVVLVETTKGYDPLLYEVALEIAKLKGCYLTSDKHSGHAVSERAISVWSKFYNRTDIEHIKIEDEECLNMNDFKYYYKDYPFLAYAYTKDNTDLIDRLKKLNKLKVVTEE